MYIKSTEGEDTLDPRYNENIRGAKRAGLKVGCYHFATPGSWQYSGDYNPQADARLEALDFIARSKKCLRKGDLRPALDLEDNGTNNIKRMGRQELADWVHRWMETVEKETGIEPILYGRRYPFRVGNTDPRIVQKYDLWLADWRPPPESGPWRKPTIWQYSETGRVKGIRGNRVDLDIYRGSWKSFKRKMLIR